MTKVPVLGDVDLIDLTKPQRNRRRGHYESEEPQARSNLLRSSFHCATSYPTNRGCDRPVGVTVEKILGLGHEGLGFTIPADEVGGSMQIDWR